MRTILLDRSSWDLVVDASGNIAVASDPYSMAQDAASNIKLFEGELYWDTTQGIPYYQQILGEAPPLSLTKQYFVEAAMLVPGVVSARCFFSGLVGRQLSGQIQITAQQGGSSAASF